MFVKKQPNKKMSQQIDILKKQRVAILNQIDQLSLDQLNKIPTGLIIIF